MPTQSERLDLVLARIKLAIEGLEDEIESAGRSLRWSGRPYYTAGLSEASRSLLHALDRVTEACEDHGPQKGV